LSNGETLKNKISEGEGIPGGEVRSEHNFAEIVGESASLRQVLKMVETVAPTESTVLIFGEHQHRQGAHRPAALHDLSPRRSRTLIKLNCAAIPTGLLEERVVWPPRRGAFTGAISQKIGRFELANHGTLFLDEVGDNSARAGNPKLSTVIAGAGSSNGLGSTKTIKVSVRLVTATTAIGGPRGAAGEVRHEALHLAPEDEEAWHFAACLV